MANEKYFRSSAALGNLVYRIRRISGRGYVEIQRTGANGQTHWNELNYRDTARFFERLALEQMGFTEHKGTLSDEPPPEVRTVFVVRRGEDTVAVLHPSIVALDEFLEANGEGLETETCLARFPQGCRSKSQKVVEDVFELI